MLLVPAGERLGVLRLEEHPADAEHRLSAASVLVHGTILPAWAIVMLRIAHPPWGGWQRGPSGLCTPWAGRPMDDDGPNGSPAHRLLTHA